MRMISLIVAASLALPAGALAAAPQQAKGSKPDKVICKSFQKTQSRIGVVRICKPRSEWEYEQREQELELDQIKSENTINLPPDTNPF